MVSQKLILGCPGCQLWSFDRWYAVGGTIQVCMFGMVASKVKMNANGAHTFLEIVNARFGTAGHLLFTFYAFLCILIVCGSLLRSCTVLIGV